MSILLGNERRKMAGQNSIFDGKVVLITGGTGSLGRALTAHLLTNCAPKKVIIFSRDEYKQSEMAKEFPDNGVLPVRYNIGDIRDLARLNLAFRGVDFVVHAAALKQADTGERDSDEFVATNVQGARNVIRAAIDQQVTRVAGLSTDKACNPVNLYGATKLVMEKLFMAARAYSSDTIFTCCRYGNVTGSRGSVVPFYLEKIAAGQPLPVTHWGMTRFVITMRQAIGVIEAAFKAPPGTIIVPKLPSVSIRTIGHALTGNIDFAAEVTGLRRGEKMAESLIGIDEPVSRAGKWFLIDYMHGKTGFQYSSDHNGSDELTADQFLELLKQ